MYFFTAESVIFEHYFKKHQNMIKVYNKNMKIICVSERRSSYAKTALEHDLQKLVEKALALGFTYSILRRKPLLAITNF